MLTYDLLVLVCLVLITVPCVCVPVNYLFVFYVFLPIKKSHAVTFSLLSLYSFMRSDIFVPPLLFMFPHVLSDDISSLSLGIC